MRPGRPSMGKGAVCRNSRSITASQAREALANVFEACILIAVSA
jgi:hypothetical protein